MDDVRIAILTSGDKVCAFMDNGAPKALHYYGDELHSYLEGSAYTYTFTASAKHEDSQYLVEGNKLSFQYRDKDYYLNIVKAYRTEYAVEVTAYGLVFELLNEDAPEYSATKAMSFEEYLSVFDAEKTIELGINEVSDKKITNEWTSTSTILARLYSLANVFSAEAEFVPELNKDYSLKKLTMNVYKENDGEYQGIGQRRKDVTLRYGINVNGITKTADITELYTAIYPVGTDGLTIASLNKQELDENGCVEFSSPSGDGCIRAVQARDRFPSNLLGNNASDRYILKRWTYDTDNVNTLYGQALAELKKICEPQVKYEVDGYFDTDIGDTVMIVDEEFVPELYLEARVTEQVRSFTDPKRNKTTFDNFTKLSSQVNDSLLEQMQALIAANKTFTCSIISDNGVVFKNNEGTTTLKASVRDGASEVMEDFAIQWYKEGEALTTGSEVTVSAEEVEGKAVYRFEALDADGAVRGEYEVTIVNVSDGKTGEPGKAGEDGKTTYLHLAYANSAEGADGFAITYFDGAKYIGTLTDYTEVDSAIYSDYTWARLKGDQGDQGDQGEKGEPGEKGDPGEDGTDGADGIGVAGVYRYYILTDEEPEAPTAYPPPGWAVTEPAYEDGSASSLYCVDVVVYTDETYAYSDVCLSSTYEAAKAAYQRAVDVETHLALALEEQTTSIMSSCESVILKALEVYTAEDDFNSFRETVEAQLQLLANEMTVKFTQATSEITSVNNDLQEKFNTITKYFTFDVNGLTIGQTDSPYKVIIDNDRYSMTVDGTEVMWISDGKVYTPEIEITKGFKLFGYLIDQDSAGNVNCGYVGGES